RLRPSDPRDPPAPGHRPVGPRHAGRDPGAARGDGAAHAVTAVAPPAVPPVAQRGRADRRTGLRASPFVVVPAVGAAAVTALPLWYLLVQAFSQGLDEVLDEVWQRRTLD